MVIPADVSLTVNVQWQAAGKQRNITIMDNVIMAILLAAQHIASVPFQTAGERKSINIMGYTIMGILH